MKIITIKNYMKDSEIDKKEGSYINESHYTRIIKENADVYYQDKDGERKLLLKFRKGVIPQKHCKDTFKALYKMAQKKNVNRGAAAGAIKTKKLPKYVHQVKTKHRFRVFYKDKKGELKKDNISNASMSNIMGYYDRPDRNHYRTSKKSPASLCRVTAFTRDHKDKWNATLPLIVKADKQFKKLVPSRHKIQHERANEVHKFQIEDTAFSTVTTNYNWRTACHKDKGDLVEGFGNLLVLEKDKCGHNCPSYKGGYLGFPKFKVCVDVRQGDFLAMDVHQWHCNTGMKEGQYDNKKNKFPKETDYGRLSLVCYLRKKMIKCKNDK